MCRSALLLESFEVVSLHFLRMDCFTRSYLLTFSSHLVVAVLSSLSIRILRLVRISRGWLSRGGDSSLSKHIERRWSLGVSVHYVSSICKLDHWASRGGLTPTLLTKPWRNVIPEPALISTG